jgi:hypothetical protein
MAGDRALSTRQAALQRRPFGSGHFRFSTQLILSICLDRYVHLFIDDARSVKLVDDVKLPVAAAKAIRAYTTLRKRADLEDRRASLATRRAVRLLRGGKLRMSARDAARLLGVSHQRVHQLIHDEA